MTAKGKRQNPLTVQLRANALRGRRYSAFSKEKMSLGKKRNWENGVYDGVNFHPRRKA